MNEAESVQIEVGREEWLAREFYTYRVYGALNNDTIDVDDGAV